MLHLGQNLAQGTVRDRHRHHEHLRLDVANLAADGRLGVLRCTVLHQAGAADVVPADHLHRLKLDLVAAKAANMEMHPVKLVVIPSLLLSIVPFGIGHR